MDEIQVPSSEVQEVAEKREVVERTRPALTRPPMKTSMAPVVQEPKRGVLWLLAALAIAALMIALVSLAANVLLIGELLAVQAEGREISYTFSDTIAYSGTVPISETVAFPFQGTVPFQGNVPFRGTVPVAINVPVLGRQTFRVPIDTTVYVDTAVEVSTTVTVPVEMTFPFAVEMPVQIPIDIALALDDQPQLLASLALTRDVLVDFRTRLFERVPSWRPPYWPR
jgi:hypothetical protein